MLSLKNRSLHVFVVLALMTVTLINGNKGKAAESIQECAMPTPVPVMATTEEMGSYMVGSGMNVSVNAEVDVPEADEPANIPAGYVSDTARKLRESIPAGSPLTSSVVSHIMKSMVRINDPDPVPTEVPEPEEPKVEVVVSGSSIRMTEKNAKIFTSLMEELSNGSIPQPDAERSSDICAAAVKYLGYPYSNEYHARFSDSADCSSFVYRTFKDVGIDLRYHKSITAASEAEKCVKKNWVISYGYDESLLYPGDLLFWTTDNPKHKNRFLDIYHTGIYLGDGKCIDASSGENAVVIRDVWEKGSIIITARPGVVTDIEEGEGSSADAEDGD